MPGQESAPTTAEKAGPEAARAGRAEEGPAGTAGGGALPAEWCDAMSDVMFVFDSESRFLHVNAAGERLIGRPAWTVVGSTLPELVAEGSGFMADNPERAHVLDQVMPHVLAGASLHDDETSVARADGATATYSWRLDPIRTADGIRGAVLIMRDMTELSNATFQAAPVGMVRVRGDGQLLEVNAAFRELAGLAGQGALLRPLRGLIHPDDRDFHDAMFAELIEGGRQRYHAERRILHSDGTVVWCHLTMTVPSRYALGPERWFDRAVGVVEDITERKRLEGELRARNTELGRLARTDLLTGLHSRRHLEERLVEAASYARRHGGGLAIVLVDVDRFRQINEGFGHHIGDEVLRAVANRLRAGKRTEDVCGRWGGEEFLVLLPHTDLSGAAAFAERVRRSVAAGSLTKAGDAAVNVTVSAGVACGDGADVEGLLRRVDVALSTAKAAGRNRVVADADRPAGRSGQAAISGPEAA